MFKSASNYILINFQSYNRVVLAVYIILNTKQLKEILVLELKRKLNSLKKSYYKYYFKNFIEL